jgi:hypothetical protein
MPLILIERKIIYHLSYTLIMGKLSATLTVKFDRILGRDVHVQFVVHGDTLTELNDNAVQLIQDYADRNNIDSIGKAEYYLGDEKGLLGSSIDVIGHL